MSAPDLRDQGLRRVSRLTGWLAAAGIVGVGAFAGLLARPHTTTTKVSAGSATTDESVPDSQTPATSSAGNSTNTTVRSGKSQRSTPPVTRPTQPPVQSRQRGPAVSGGS